MECMAGGCVIQGMRMRHNRVCECRCFFEFYFPFFALLCFVFAVVVLLLCCVCVLHHAWFAPPRPSVVCDEVLMRCCLRVGSIGCMHDDAIDANDVMT